MAAKSSGATASKSDAVREYFAAHKSAAVKDVVAALSEQGLEVSTALVNKIKYSGAKSKRGRKAAKPGRKPKAAASSDGVSKAQAIRDTIKLLGRKARPRDVIAHLADNGVQVSAAQVSAIRKTAGLRSGKATPAAAALGHNGGLSLDHLLAAKKLADLVGIEAAKKALDALAKLAL